MSVTKEENSGTSWIRRTLITIVILNALVLAAYCFFVPPLFEELEGHRTGVNCAATSENGAFLATGTDAGVIRIWENDGQLLMNITGHSGRINCMSFSAFGNRLATGGGDGEIRVWAVPEGIETVMLKEDSEAVVDLAFSDDGQWLYSVGETASIFIWNVSEGKLVEKVPLPAVGTSLALH